MHTVQQVLATMDANGKIMLGVGDDYRGWYTVFNNNTGMRAIVFYSEEGDDWKFYATNESFAKRVVGLLKRGY